MRCWTAIALPLLLLLGSPAAAQEQAEIPEPADIAEETDAGTEIGSGMASYYGRELAGNRTANGERFDPAQMTAAHPSLPFGSRVRVTHLGNGKSVIVRINDRGPFSRSRVIDISHAAARAIDMHRSGTAQVRMTLIED